jgi:RNA polymerase sigma factor (sigma-70 family)
MPGPETRALILAAQLGDSAALDRLLLMSQKDARRYARLHCQSSDVDDAVQEALLILVKKISALKAAAAFTGWLFTIVRRECQRLSRAMLQHESLDDERVETYLADKTDVVLRLDLSFALESLPAHYRQVILLRDFEEQTIAEMADALGFHAEVREGSSSARSRRAAAERYRQRGAKCALRSRASKLFFAICAF